MLSMRLAHTYLAKLGPPPSTPRAETTPQLLGDGAWWAWSAERGLGLKLGRIALGTKQGLRADAKTLQGPGPS